MQKKAFQLSIILIGLSAGIFTGLILNILDEPLALSEITLFLFSIPINIILLVLLGAPLWVYLRNITRSLARLNDGQTAEPVQALPFGLFSELTHAVNQMIANQQEFQMARGRLYEQISEVAAQEERKRLARDLHDSIKQQVFSISISAAAAHAHLANNPTAAREALLDVKQSAQEAMVEMRALLQQLSPAPLEKSGLIEALREQCEALSYRTGARVQTQFGDLPPDDRLPTGTQAVIFRIAQEALSNIARHARAQHVDLKLYVKDDSHVVLTIHDDGQGFDTTAVSSGMGMGNMRSRAESIQAEFEIVSRPADGTHLTVTIPLVKLTTQEEPMFEQYEAERQAVIAQYWLFGGAAAATIFSASLILWRAISRSGEFLAGGAMPVILVVLLSVVVVGIPMSVITGRQAHQKTHRLLQIVQNDRRTASWLKRHWHMMQLVIAFVAAVFVPQLTVNPWLPALTPVAVSLIFIAISGWHFFQMYSLYRDEVDHMPAIERIDEMDKRLGELRSSWISLFMLLVIQLVTLNLGDAMRFPPQNADHWITFSFMSLTVLLFINQFISIWLYRQWRDEARQEVMT
jgi:signal transduction histidine kinase